MDYKHLAKLAFTVLEAQTAAYEEALGRLSETEKVPRELWESLQKAKIVCQVIADHLGDDNPKDSLS